MKVHFDSADYLIVSAENLIVSIALGRALPGMAATTLEVMKDVAASSTGKIVILAMVGTKAEAPDKELRKRFAAGVEEMADEIALIIQYPLATGFRGAFVRSVMTAIHFLTNSNVETCVVTSIEAAQRCAQPHTSLSPAEIEDLIGAVQNGRVQAPK